MVEYRKKSTTAQSNNEVEEPHRAPSGEAYMELAAQYGLDDMVIGNPDDNPQQTVEDEYNAYMTAPLSSMKVTSLKFWEVRGDINGVTLLTRYGRLIGQRFQHCLRWQWTIFPSKHHLFLANGSSPQVPKQTPSGGTD